MVAGQAGGGKSTFLRGLITTLYLNNQGIEFTLIDLKGGLEFQTFENLKRVKVDQKRSSGCFHTLQFLEATLTEQTNLLKQMIAKDIDAYLALSKDRKRNKGVCFSRSREPPPDCNR